MDRPGPKDRPSGPSRQTLSLSLAEGIEAKAVHAALDKIFEISGCPACGLLGLDLNFRVLPQDVLRRFDNLARGGMELQQIDGIHGFSISEFGR